MVFVKRRLDEGPQTLGEKLRMLRRGKAVSLDMMERKTHIQRSYLEALEQGAYEDLPEPMYVRNFIRAYARFLGADDTYLLELYQEECGRCDLVGPMQAPRQKVRSGRLAIWNQYVKFGSLACTVLLLVGYLGWQVSSLLAPPEVVLTTPSHEALVQEALVTVSGYVDGEASVYVNGEPVVVDDDATFTKDVYLEEGLNTIVVEAERRYSRRTLVERSVVFDPNDRIVIK